jgi:hypothetical protein
MVNERQYIKRAIFDWVIAILEEDGRAETAIWDYDDGPRPEPPFISLEFTGINSPGHPDFSMVDVDPKNPLDMGTRTITQYIKRALTMYAFGEGALDLLEVIKTSIYMEKYCQMLNEKGLVILKALEVIENPATRDGIKTEQNALFDFYVTYMRVIKDDSSGWIESVHINPPENLPMEEIVVKREKAKCQIF